MLFCIAYQNSNGKPKFNEFFAQQIKNSRIKLCLKRLNIYVIVITMMCSKVKLDKCYLKIILLQTDLKYEKVVYFYKQL